MNSHFYKGALFAILGGTCWGISGSVGQFLFQSEGMDSRWLVPIRLAGAGIILLIYSIIRYRKLVLGPWKKPKNAIKLLVYGIPGVAFCQFFYFLTIQLSSAAIGTIMQDLSPIFILLATCMLSKRLPKIFEILSIILAIVGVFLLVTHGRFDGSGMSLAVLGTGLMAALTVMIYNVVPGKLLEEFPITILQGWSFLLGGIVIACVFRSWTIKYVPTPVGLVGILVVIVIGNILAFSLYMSGVKYIGPNKAILFGFSEPVSAAIITVLFLGTSFVWIDIIGFILIFGMLVLNSFGKKEKAVKE